jgi:selenoprotein W-related protein
MAYFRRIHSLDPKASAASLKSIRSTKPARTIHSSDGAANLPEPQKPRIAITYCTQCRWLLRAAWMAQELLTTFPDTIGEIALIPATGGRFRIDCDGEMIWERERDGGFPDIKVLKRLIRDKIDPGHDLGHTDRS